MRILGLDIGTTSVKAVEIDSAFGRYEVHEYHEKVIPAGAQAIEIAHELIASLPKAPDKIAMSLRTARSTFRNLQLPTRDKKAIQSSVGFELEDDLPFDLDNAVYDYSVLSQNQQGTHVHVAATLKKHLAGPLSELQLLEIEPDLITTEAWAYRSLLNRVRNPQNLPQQDDQPVLFVQVGHDHTTLYVHWKGTPVMAREISLGGRDITMAICQRYNIPLDQAERAKLDHGFILPPSQKDQATQEQIEFSETILAPALELVREIRQACLACKNATHLGVSLIYLGGGSSLLPGLGRLIEEELNLPVQPLLALASMGTSGVTYTEETEASFVLAAALSLCLVGANRSSIINLRKGEFSKQGKNHELNLENLKRPLAAAGAVFLCLFLSLAVQSSVYQSRLKVADTQLEKSVKSFFGQLSSSAVRTYLSDTKKLRSSINAELGKQRETSKLMGSNPRSPINFLKELSSTISKDVVVDMIQFQAGASPASAYVSTPTAGDTDASLTFLMTDKAAVDKLSSMLEKKMTGVQKTAGEEVTLADGTSKRWKITFTGKPTEDSYGK